MSKAKTSLERGMELMTMPMRELPILAYGLMQAMSRQMGGCGEVCLTAYCMYAEVIEKFPAEDIEYAAKSFPKYAPLLEKGFKVDIQFVD